MAWQARQGRMRPGPIRTGQARQAWHGAARHKRYGLAWRVEAGEVCQGMARRCLARSGKARPGPFRQGEAGPACSGEVCRGQAWHGGREAGEARPE